MLSWHDCTAGSPLFRLEAAALQVMNFSFFTFAVDGNNAQFERALKHQVQGKFSVVIIGNNSFININL